MKRRKSARRAAGLKSNGTLKKGYRFAKGGRVVKARAKSKRR